jgi:hypothetical protein
MPPLTDDSSDSEKQLRQMTEESILQAAHQHASAFLASSAQFLMDSNTKNDLTNKLKKIYSDAARLSYMLWTRRTAMRCLTLHEIRDLSFNSESRDFDPDPLVRWEDRGDDLEDEPITLMVHPILKVYGTDEGRDYDQE